MTEAFIRNLKLLNAKERDHLMRFAYLGQSTPYESTSTFLSIEADKRLRTHALEMGLAESAKCVFAGMDYHLDWLFAAIWIAKTSPSWTAGDDSDRPSQAMASHEAVADLKHLYTDFRSVSGSQEDVDLLVVYDDGNRLAVLFVEAKGSASFDKVQLARKVIRLDRILVDSGMTSQENRLLEFRLILAAPYEPSFNCCLEHAKTLPRGKPGEPDKFSAMRVALEGLHPSGIGKGLHFLKITGFPKETYAVERERRSPEFPGEANVVELDCKSGAFTHWALRKRS